MIDERRRINRRIGGIIVQRWTGRMLCSRCRMRRSKCIIIWWIKCHCRICDIVWREIRWLLCHHGRCVDDMGWCVWRIDLLHRIDLPWPIWFTICSATSGLIAPWPPLSGKMVRPLRLHRMWGLLLLCVGHIATMSFRKQSDEQITAHDSPDRYQFDSCLEHNFPYMAAIASYVN